MLNLVILIILSVNLIGCESLQRATNRDGLTQAEAIERERENEASQRALRAQQAQARAKALRPGVSMAEFKAAFGEPSATNYDNGTYGFWYDDQERPMYYYFKNDKLVKWESDMATISARRKAQQDKEIAEESRGQTCYTSQVFGSLVTNCY